MKANPGLILAIGLIIGILIGLSVGYVLFSSTPKAGWHEVTSFTVASSGVEIPGWVQVAYSVPDVYPGQGPLFSVKTEVWRIVVQTVPYFNYTGNGDSMIIYYNQQPINKIRVWKDQAYVDNPFSSIVLLDPLYDYNVNTVGTAQASDQFLYVSWKEAYTPAQTTQTLTGAGTYLISLDTGITCLKFTIEEYN
jgi:hypothetical protein